MSGARLEVVEVYDLLGERRWRIRVVGTRVVLNVAAATREEALRRAEEILSRVGLKPLLDEPRGDG